MAEPIELCEVHSCFTLFVYSMKIENSFNNHSDIYDILLLKTWKRSQSHMGLI